MSLSPLAFNIRTSNYPATIEVFKLSELLEIEKHALSQPNFYSANLPSGAKKIFSQVIEANQSAEIEDGSGGGHFYLLKGTFDGRNITQIYPRQEIKEGQSIQFSGVGFSFFKFERPDSPAANPSDNENKSVHSSQASSASVSDCGSSVDSLIEAGFVIRDQNGAPTLNTAAVQKLEEDFKNQVSEID